MSMSTRRLVHAIRRFVQEARNHYGMSVQQAIAEYRRTGKHLGIFGTHQEATAYAESLHNAQAREYGNRPVANGKSVVEQLFPHARVTDWRRDPKSKLGRANPDSWHNRSSGAVDVAPIPGMTFAQYVSRIRAAGYNIIQAQDEVNNPSSHATGPHWHVVIGEK